MSVATDTSTTPLKLIPARVCRQSTTPAARGVPQLSPGKYFGAVPPPLSATGCLMRRAAAGLADVGRVAHRRPRLVLLVAYDRRPRGRRVRDRRAADHDGVLRDGLVRPRRLLLRGLGRGFLRGFFGRLLGRLLLGEGD